MNCPRCNGPATEETLREFGGVCPKCLLKFAEEKDAPAFPSLEIVEMIGQGGMGVVYKAVQKSLGRTVALKVLSPQLSNDPEFVERFTREAKALAQLSHPNIVAIHDSGIHDKVPYLVMEFVEGRSLRQLLASRELTAPQALELVPQICDALYYAHAKGVIHRDIKPENILIDGAGRVKIADYGLAKIASLDQPRITKTNFAMGTPHYMAPEQIEKSSEVDHRADIYSLGVVIYEMLTGELPLGRFKPPSERAEVDRRLDRVVLKSLEKEPADRYQSANEVKEQLSQPAEEVAVPMLPQTGKVDLLGMAFYALVALLSAGCATSFALRHTGAGVTFLFTTLMFLAVAIFRTLAVHQTRQGARPAATTPRLSKLAVASGSLCLAGLPTALAAIIVFMNDMPNGAGAVFCVAAAFWFASIPISIAAFFVILFSNGRLRGLWIPITSGISSALLLLISGVGLFAGASAPVPAAAPVTTVSAPAASDEWREPYRVPAGFRYDVKATQDLAFTFSGLPKELRNAVSIIQFGRFTPGNANLVYLRFHSAGARQQWLDKPELSENPDGWIRRVLSGEEGLWLLRRGDMPANSPGLNALIDGIRLPQARNR